MSILHVNYLIFNLELFVIDIVFIVSLTLKILKYGGGEIINLQILCTFKYKLQVGATKAVEELLRKIIRRVV